VSLVRPVIRRPSWALPWLLLVGCVGARSSAPLAAPMPAVAVMSAPGPAPRVPAPLPTGEAIGTAHPIAVQASADDGRWVVACQARRDSNNDGSISVAIGMHGDFYGDLMTPYLIVGAGEGEALDAFVASDPADRWIVTIEGAALTLRDTIEGTRRVLDTGGLIRDPKGAGGDMIAGFDGERSLVYLRGRDVMARTIVVHELASGRERTIDPGPGKLLHAFVAADGGQVVVAVDLPVAGRVLARRSYTSAHRGPCRGPMMSSFSSASGGPPGEVRVIDLADDTRLNLPGGEGRLIGVLGAQAIVRRPDGSIWGVALDGDAPPLQLVHATCRGKILGASVARGSLLIHCDSIENPRLQLHDARGVRLLEHRSGGGYEDDWRGGDRPRPILHLASSVILVDLEAGRSRRIALPDDPNAHNLEWSARGLLRRSNGGLQLIDLDDGSVRALDARVDEYPGGRSVGSIVALDRLIVDVAAKQLLGVVPAVPAALTAGGHALTAEAPAPGGVRMSGVVTQGPLRWRWPTACVGTCPEGPV